MNAESESPGANDNASGMAGVLEAARVLSRHRFPASIALVGLSGEEQGLFGGAILAEYAIANGWNLDAVLNGDTCKRSVTSAAAVPQQPGRGRHTAAAHDKIGQLS